MLAQDIDNLTHRCYDIAASKGFWQMPFDDENPFTVPVKLFLIVSEACEALKADRDEHDPQIRQMEILEELADVVIRTLDLAHKVSGYGGQKSFGRILLEKMETNRQRSPKHGKRY